jgi:hypothetical protein
MCVVLEPDPSGPQMPTGPLLHVNPVAVNVSVVPGVTVIARVGAATEGLSDHPALLPAGMSDSQMSAVPGTVLLTDDPVDSTAIAVADTSQVVRIAPDPLNSGNVSGTAFPVAAVLEAVTCTASGVPLPAVNVCVDAFQ